MSQTTEVKVEESTHVEGVLTEQVSNTTHLSDISHILEWTGKKIRVYGTVNKPWFCGLDITDALGYLNGKKALQTHVKIHNKIPGSQIVTGCGMGPVTYAEKRAIYVNEPGLYSLIMRSELPEAEAFQNWVTDIVLPSIRKTGSYKLNAQLQTLQSELANQRLLTDQTARLAEEQRKIAEEEKKRANDARLLAEEEKKRADDAKAEAERVKQEKIESDEKHRKEVAALERASERSREGFKEQMRKRDHNMYVITSDQNKVKDMYKVGRTKNRADMRVLTLNTGLTNNESLYCVASYVCADACSIEDRVHKLLAPFRDSINREFFQIPFAQLHSLINSVIKNQSDEYEMSCILIDNIIGHPMPCGIDADSYTAGIAAVNQAVSVPILLNADLAHGAMAEWLKTVPPNPSKLDWVKFQPFLKTYLDAKKFPKGRYRAREWKDLASAAFTAATVPAADGSSSSQQN
jgi:prophage antirepressor-like protein